MEKKAKRRIFFYGAVALLLTVCLAISAYGYSRANITVENNVFSTGNVSLELNGGKPIIEKGAIKFNPGHSEARYFYIENNGENDLYYKFWFENVSGPLAKYITADIYNGDTLLASGTLEALTKSAFESTDPLLAVGERRTFRVVFTMSEEARNIAQEKKVDFVFCAGATQVKNNPDRIF